LHSSNLLILDSIKSLSVADRFAQVTNAEISGVIVHHFHTKTQRMILEKALTEQIIGVAIEKHFKIISLCICLAPTF